MAYREIRFVHEGNIFYILHSSHSFGNRLDLWQKECQQTHETLSEFYNKEPMRCLGVRECLGEENAHKDVPVLEAIFKKQSHSVPFRSSSSARD